MTKTHNTGSERSRTAAAIDVWENEGGAPRGDSMNHHYGRRVEADRSWTVYHVFTGIPAHVGGDVMTGLSRSAATSRMLSLNLRNVERQGERVRLPSIVRKVPETTACRS